MQERNLKVSKKDKKDKDVYLQAINIIDPYTCWIETHSVQEATVDLVANQLELAWLISYLLSKDIIVLVKNSQ